MLKQETFTLGFVLGTLFGVVAILSILAISYSHL